MARENKIEFTKFKLFAKVERSGLSVFSAFRGKLQLKATFTFILGAGADGTLGPVVAELKDSQAEEIPSEELTLPKLKAGFEYYDLDYTVITSIDGKANPQENGTVQLRVWPDLVTVTTTFKDGGKKAPDFEFDLIQGEKALAKGVRTAQASEEKDAEFSKKLVGFGALGVQPISPWILDEREDPKPGKVWKLKVTKKPWKAKIYSPAGGKTAEAPIQQLVNQAQDFAKNCGNWVKLEVGPDDLELGKQDEEIKVRVTFPATNSQRDDPKPALWTGAFDAKIIVAAKVPAAEPGKAELVYEAVLKLAADKGKAACHIQMGLAGGDSCKVEVGVTDTYADDVAHIVNWRKIGVELLVPDVTIRQDCPAMLSTALPAHGADLIAKLKRLLDLCYITLDYPATHIHLFDAADADGIVGSNFDTMMTTDKGKTKGATLVIDGAKYSNWVRTPGNWPWSDDVWEKKPLAGKIFITSHDNLGKIRDKITLSAVLPKDTMSIRWCDFLANRETKTDVKGDLNFVTREFDNLTPIVVDPIRFNVFDDDPFAMDGTSSIRKLNWRVLKVRKQGESTWLNPPVWVKKTGWQAAASATKVDIAKYVVINDSKKLTLTLPNTAVDDPGKFITQINNEDDGTGKGTKKDFTYECQIQLEVLAVGIHFNVLGSALQGVISMTSQGGATTDHGAAHTIAHELGHNLGQTYIRNLGAGELHATPAGTDGRGRNIAYEIPGIPFGKVVGEGPYFAGKGYAGAHCATAIKKKVDAALSGPTNAAKRKAVYDEPSWGQPSATNQTYFEVKDEVQCIMFATTDNALAKPKDFCPDCLIFIKATDASNIQKDWRS